MENTKEVVTEFERRMNAEVRKQKRIKRAEEKDFRREDLLGKYTTKILYCYKLKTLGLVKRVNLVLG